MVMRSVLSINQNWLYKPSFSPETDLKKGAGAGYEPVCLPHSNIQLPYNYFDEAAFCFVCCYKRAISLQHQWRGQRLFLDFEGVMSYARVYLNGRMAGEHKGGYTAFSVEITDLVDFFGDNEITVVVDATERPDTPPFGGRIDYLTYGGIYREVQLRVVSSVYIQDVFVKTPEALAEDKQLVADIRLDGLGGALPRGLSLEVALWDVETLVARQAGAVASDNPTRLHLKGLKGIGLWSLKQPKLYQLSCVLLKDGQEIDRYALRMGFRDIRFTAEGFFLNGERIQLTGLNRHQAYPYVGYAMPGRVQRRDADILKDELGLNCVRTSHYPQSRHFLDRCDEIGLMVFEEIPGWQHVGDEAWQQQVLLDVEQMIISHRNHPSIFLWGVRVNESQDHHELYTRSNARARALDPTRPTGGARFIPNSELLEDVYTMNDFIHDNGYGKYLASVVRNYQTYDHLIGWDGEATALREPREVTGLQEEVPYLVTEYCGHMYPTKRFDQEERLVEHALRHARVQNAAQAHPHIAGAIGWCAFDYNTHADFGAGDKICYHGVMDMFRIPKLAAYAYRSQKSPQEEIVMEPGSCWAYGERSMGGVIPLVIFTNCDAVDFIYGGRLLGTYTPDFARYPALKHPPVTVDDMTANWGMRWEDATFVGRINGEEVIRRSFARNPYPGGLSLALDDTRLQAGDWDATRAVASVKDQLGNIMPFFIEPIKVQVQGPGQIIGPDTLSLIGGQIAFWVKTTGPAGDIALTVSCPRLGEEVRVVIRVE